MKKIIVLLILLFTINITLSAATGHFPFTTLGFRDGTRSSNYSVDPNQRQATGSTNSADSDIISTDDVDIFVRFDYDTDGKNVYIVYTTDGNAPTKGNGSTISCSFEKFDDPDRWWYGTIPSKASGTYIKYVIYISNSDLASAYGRVAEDGYNTSWNEGDSYFGYGSSENSTSTYHTVYFTGNFLNDWRGNENVAVDENSTFYLSWDETYLHVGISTTDLDFSKVDPDRLNIGIDKDPGGSNGDATSSFAGYNFSTNNDDNHKLDYIVQYSNEFTNNSKLFDGVDGSFDSGTNKDYTNNINQKNVEIRVPWSDLSDRPTTTWGIILWTSNDDNNWVMSSFPNDNPTGNASTALNVVNYHQYSSAGSGINPSTDGSNQTLPVELSTFTAQYLNSKPTLYWTTQSETDNMGWFVYRNKIEDFTSATKVSGMIEGHGTTTQMQSYIYEDVIANPQVGDVYYYWLESVDYSGTIHHFDKMAMITIPETNDPNPNVTTPQVYDLLASPNPFNESTKISFTLTQSAMVDVAIYDVKGALVKSFDTQHVTANDEVLLKWYGNDENSKSLSNGIYLYSVKVNGQEYSTKQVILMK